MPTPNSAWFHHNYERSRGGGVAMYISKIYKFKILTEINMMTPTTESPIIEILTRGKKGIMIGVFYRSPYTNSNDFLEEY